MNLRHCVSTNRSNPCIAVMTSPGNGDDINLATKMRSGSIVVVVSAAVPSRRQTQIARDPITNSGAAWRLLSAL
jgi:hypothetical protein